MWKCPNCETLNDDDVCVVCGENKLIADNIESKPSHIISFETISAEVEPAEVACETEIERKSNRIKKLITVIAVSAIIIILIILFYAHLENNKSVVAISDSVEQLEIAKTKLYQKGVLLYQNGILQNALNCFEEVIDMDRAGDYITLINAKLYDNVDISELKPLIGFEDTAEIIVENDGLLQEFLMGCWSCSEGYYIEYYNKENDDLIWYSCNFISTEGGHFDLRNGIHYTGSDATGWEEQLNYKIISKNEVAAYCYNDGITYILRKY